MAAAPKVCFQRFQADLLLGGARNERARSCSAVFCAAGVCNPCASQASYPAPGPACGKTQSPCPAFSPTKLKNVRAMEHALSTPNASWVFIPPRPWLAKPCHKKARNRARPISRPEGLSRSPRPGRDAFSREHAPWGHCRCRSVPFPRLTSRALPKCSCTWDTRCTRGTCRVGRCE